MLRISRMSGEELTIVLEEDLIPNVRALKQHLNLLQGLPPRFRQRLLFHGQCLEDTASLHPGMELELVLLAIPPKRWPLEVQEFTAAAGAGHIDKVLELNETRLRTSQREQNMQRRGPMMLVIGAAKMALFFSTPVSATSLIPCRVP